MTTQWALALEEVCVGLVFPEAPTWFNDSLWVSDVTGGGVHRVLPGHGRETFLAERRGVGGLLVTRGGGLVASGPDLVRVADGSVVRTRPSGSTGLNDLGVDHGGTAYVGVLTFRPVRGEPPTPGQVARLSLDGDDWQWWSAPVWPNGIAVTSDGSLIVADFADGRLWRHTSSGWDVMGTSPTGHVDGLAIDALDRVWVATGPGATIECWSTERGMLASYPVQASFVSSLCFGGTDLMTLFATVSGYRGASGAVLAAPAEVAGSPVPPARL